MGPYLAAIAAMEHTLDLSTFCAGNLGISLRTPLELHTVRLPDVALQREHANPRPQMWNMFDH